MLHNHLCIILIIFFFSLSVSSDHLSLWTCQIFYLNGFFFFLLARTLILLHQFHSNIQTYSGDFYRHIRQYYTTNTIRPKMFIRVSESPNSKYDTILLFNYSIFNFMFCFRSKSWIQLVRLTFHKDLSCKLTYFI